MSGYTIKYVEKVKHQRLESLGSDFGIALANLLPNSFWRLVAPISNWVQQKWMRWVYE